jgi:uncharacterized protein
MNMGDGTPVLEVKFTAMGQVEASTDGTAIEGYASLFGKVDQGGDIVRPGAYLASLKRLSDAGRRVKMLWQHDPTRPIGIWDVVRDDDRGLYVKGRILPDIAQGREAAALVAAGAIDGLSIGYRTVTSERDGKGRRVLSVLDLWEVSLVTFPMLPDARVGAKAEAAEAELMAEMAQALRRAGEVLRGG